MEKRQPITAVIGLDLGTSCSKVVVQLPEIAGGWAAIAEIGDPYLVPTPFDRGTSIKVALMNHPDERRQVRLVAEHLSDIVRATRGWFLRAHGALAAQYDLQWILNVGIPSAGYDDDDVREGFGWAARAAYSIGLSDAEFVNSPAVEIRSALERTWNEENTRVAVHPEVAAAAVGYARSQFREEGLHVLVDIGATTLDVCGFILGKYEGSDRYNLMTALVLSHGAHELHAWRLEFLEGSEVRPECAALDLGIPDIAIPNSICDYVVGPCSPEQKDAEDLFRQNCCRQIMSVMVELRKRRDPNAPAWADGVPVLVAGGGSHMRFYHDTLKDMIKRVHKAFHNVQSPKTRRLPVPSRLQRQLGEKKYVRFAVAYGLSFESIEIGEIRPPSDFADMPGAKRRPPEEFISKDHV